MSPVTPPIENSALAVTGTAETGGVTIGTCLFFKKKKRVGGRRSLALERPGLQDAFGRGMDDPRAHVVMGYILGRGRDSYGLYSCGLCI